MRFFSDSGDDPVGAVDRRNGRRNGLRETAGLHDRERRRHLGEKAA